MLTNSALTFQIVQTLASSSAQLQIGVFSWLMCVIILMTMTVVIGQMRSIAVSLDSFSNTFN